MTVWRSFDDWMVDPMTQTDRILALLRQAGDAGVCTRELLDRRMPRYAARILDLRRRGYLIDTVPCMAPGHNHRSRQVRYALRSPRLFV